MFDTLGGQKKRDLPEYTMVSLGLHALIVGALIGLTALKVHRDAKKEVEVAFLGPGKGKGQPPPPPPPAAKKRSMTPRRKLAKVEVPKPVIDIRPKIEPPVEPPDVDEPEDEGQEGGVEGGVAGGVVGGVLGGVVGGTVGAGGGMQPAERPKPKNVPPFVIARDMIRQDPPRMSEVFKEAHRGQTVNGMYKVCVDTDGTVYEVTPVKAVEGANDEIVAGIKQDWLYKAQQVPVCFLYNMVVTVRQ